MAKLSLLLVTIVICSALEAVLGLPGYFAPPPPPPPPPPFFPVYHTQNWSGIAKSSDGRPQGVFSGAAAAANSGQNTGQAISLASSSVGTSGAQSDECDEGQSTQNGAQSGSAANGQPLGGLGQFEGSHNGKIQRVDGYGPIGIGKLEQNSNFGGHLNGDGYGKFSSFKKESHYSFETGAGQDFKGQGQGGQSQSSGFGGPAPGNNNFHSDFNGGGQGAFSSSQAKSSFGSHSNAGESEQAALVNGNGPYGKIHNHESSGFGQVGDYYKHNDQSSYDLNQHSIQGNGFGQQSQQAGGLAASSASSQSSANVQGGPFQGKQYESYQGGYGHGLKHQYGQDSSFGSSQYKLDSNAGNLQQQADLGSGSFSAGSNAAGSEHKDALTGALNLASQGLDSAKNAGCSTCAGKGGYALSNARSHSGSAVAVSIGG